MTSGEETRFKLDNRIGYHLTALFDLTHTDLNVVVGSTDAKTNVRLNAKLLENYKVKF